MRVLAHPLILPQITNDLGLCYGHLTRVQDTKVHQVMRDFTLIQYLVHGGTYNKRVVKS